ncbi:hypothetical protein HX744_00860 [Pseudonocardia sp. ICBG1122]|nr:hypothetical protein [Pseudonocardia pini]
MIPSQTSEGIHWLANFRSREQPYAQLLLDSLHVATTSSVITALSSITDNLVDTTKNGPIAVFPVRDVRELQQREPDQPRISRPVMYESGVRPDSPFSGNPGSESIVSVEARNYRGKGAARDGFLPLDSDLEKLRSNRCREIYFWDDFAGSGDKAIKYLETWNRNSTIRSWRSFGWIRLSLIVYAATLTAEHRIRRSKYVDQLHILQTAPTIETSQWTRHDFKRIDNLCHRYAAPKTRPLGYKASGGLLVMEHTVPNNLPSIITQTDAPTVLHDSTWNPFLPFFRIPTELRNKIVPYQPVPTSRQVLDLAGSSLDPAVVAARGSQVEEIAHFLALIATGTRIPGQIALELARSVPEVEDSLSRLRGMGLLTDGVQLTDAGREELRRSGFRGREVRFTLEESSDIYYPQQLRGVGDI